MKKIILTILMGLLILSGCSATDDSQETTSKPIIAVAIAPLKGFAETIVGDKMEVSLMIPQGASPENYEITSSQMMSFNDAQVYFSLELPAEVNSILPVVSETTEVIDLKTIVAASYPTLKLGDEDDPHIWMSIKRSEVMVATMLSEIEKLDPDNRDFYEANAQALLQELSDLDTEVTAALAATDVKEFIAYHPAFQYFADDYGLKMIAIEEDGKEATASQLMEIVDYAKAASIKAIFYQAEIDSSQAESIASEIGGETIQLNPLAEDYIANYREMVDLISNN